MTSARLKQLLNSLEKKISKNQLMRAKYPENPERCVSKHPACVAAALRAAGRLMRLHRLASLRVCSFLDSEVELHAELKVLFELAASAELYPDFIAQGGVKAVAGLLSHENTDIALDAVELLDDLTDSDAVADREEEAVALCEAMVSG